MVFLKKHLLPANQNCYKAGLHTHSTVSDGKLTPLELKALYQAKGYSILALTDHHIIAAHPELNDPEFLMLTGIELSMETADYAPPQSFFGETYHFNLIAKQPNNLWQPYPPKTINDNNRPYAEKAHWDDAQRVCSVECANRFIQRANEEGFLVIYNHPTWSGQCWREYSQLRGLWALELRNTHNCMMGYDDNNHRVYRDMLAFDNHLCVVAADDTHRPHTVGGSWTMICAPALTYDSVIAAMERGDIYASCGPEIHSICLEDNTLTLTCSEAAQVCLETQARYALRCAGENGTPITTAQFDLSVWKQKSNSDPNAYIRFTVTAPDGSYAATRAYRMDELF